jgi:4-hydroxy-3-methylbut-2-enyl diphosphate reductase
MSPDWVVFAAMRAEARAVRRGLPAHAPVRRTGTGPARAARAARRHRRAGPVAVVGIAGGLHPGLRTGDVVVASEVRPDGPGPVLVCPAAPLLADLLRRCGRVVHVGPVVTAGRLVTGPARDRLAATGALAVDTESAVLLAGLAGRPVACVRVVADVAGRPLLRPSTLPRVLAAVRVLAALGPALTRWAASAGGLGAGTGGG